MANPQNDNVVATDVADIGDLRRKLQALNAQYIDVEKRGKSSAKDYADQKADLKDEISMVVAELENLEKSV
jgi:phage host-nuclease inhibitor protein Gam